MLMVLGQAIDHLVQRHNAGCGNHAGLAHAATDHFAQAPGFADECRVTGQDRPNRRRQPFRQTELHRIDVLGNLTHIGAQGDGSVEQTGAVEVDLEAGFVCKGLDLGHIAGLDHDAAHAAVRVFEADEPGERGMQIVGVAHRAGQRVEWNLAHVCIRERMVCNAAEDRCAACFVVVDMTFVAHQDLVAAAAVGQYATQVTHRATRHKQRGFFAYFGGSQLLEGVDGWIVAVDVVAQWGVEHGLAHGGRWMRDGITTQVNDGAHMGAPLVDEIIIVLFGRPY